MPALSVRDVMSSPVIAVSSRTPLPQINTVMRTHQIRRLPVVENDQLVGLITFGDVRSALPSDATSLSIYEMSYLLEQVTAAEIMHKQVRTIAPDAPISKAAQQMLEHKISGLPVVERGRLVGIITESDIFRAITDGLIEIKDARLNTEAIPPLRARART